MGAWSYRRETCRLCGSRDLQLVIQLEPTPVASAYVPVESLDEDQQTYPLDLFFCCNCSHLQLLDVVDLGFLARTLSHMKYSPGMEDHRQAHAHDILEYMKPPSEALVVDIGSHDGPPLSYFQARGIRVLGICPAGTSTTQDASPDIETISGDFSSVLARRIRDEYGPAAIITATSVIGNIDDPSDMAEGLRELLAPDGVFVFETGYLVDLLQNTIFDNIYHEHLGYHSVKPLVDFLRRHGLELVNAERVPTKGGSLRGTVQVAGGPRSVCPSVGELTALEEEMELDRPEPYKTFVGRIDTAKRRLLTLLHDIRSRGKTIGGYGASHSVTTMIYHFGLGSMLSFLVDDNALKQNLYSPGQHLPVLSPEAIYQRDLDYVIVLPWRFSQRIVEKHQAYLARGGHFITPLPELEVV